MSYGPEHLLKIACFDTVFHSFMPGVGHSAAAAAALWLPRISAGLELVLCLTES
jgi:hypothetical protein